MTDEIDYRSILIRYIRAVMDDDEVVANRCLRPNSTAYAPKWTDAECQALESVHKEAWDSDNTYDSPWSKDKFWK